MDNTGKIDGVLVYIYTECLKNNIKASDLTVIMPNLNPFRGVEVSIQRYFDYFKGR